MPQRDLYGCRPAGARNVIEPLALRRWPLVRQLLSGGGGTGSEAMSPATIALQPRNAGAGVARSVCPYCAVGCGQLVFHRDNRLVSIEGDPASPISAGHLCPKGAASFELLTHSKRLQRVRIVRRTRPPGRSSSSTRPWT